MHPELKLDKPGPCPICGMDLEPIDAADDLAYEREYHYWSIRFWFAAILTIPVVVLSMADLGYSWIQFILTSLVVCWAGAVFYKRAWMSVINRSLNMFSLIGLGTGTAYLFSVTAWLFPGIFSESFQVNGKMATYFESAAVIITLVLLGQMLEAGARSKTGMALRALMRKAPKVARRIDRNGEHEVSIDEVEVGDKLRVLSGEKVPVDGLIVEGQSHVDEAIITGEGIPVKKQKDDQVTGGTMNQEGSFIMIAERVGSATILAQIVEMVIKAQRSRPPIQRVADKVSEYFVPVVIVIALLTFVSWGIWGPQPRLVHALVYAVAVLIIACPCALGLATPVSVIVGIGRGAEMGILIKNAEALELMEKVTTLVVDKTGTLTEGIPGIVSIYVTKGFTEERVLQLAAMVEQGSEHPIAKAILRESKKRNISLYNVQGFEAIAGKGVKGNFEGKVLTVGNGSMVGKSSLTISEDIEKTRQKFETEAKTVVYVSEDDVVIGIIAVADLIKTTSAQAIKELHAIGLRIVMLTGDNDGVAKYVAGELGIDEYHACVDPVEKGNWIEKLKSTGEIVAMAGDGVNDAVALAKADVGIAMGPGSDVAIECANVTLIKGDLMAIKRAIVLSRSTLRNIFQNLFFAFIYNSLGVPIAAGLLYPIWKITLSPMIAGLAMSLSSASVLVNALRLRNIKID